MLNKYIFFILLTTFSFALKADVISSVNNAYTKGYVHSKLEDRFSNQIIQFDTQDNTIIVYVFPNDQVICNEIQIYLESLTTCNVRFDATYEPCLILESEPMIGMETQEGDFLPELSPFFPTMLAQPHIIGFSAGYRTYEKAFRTSTLPVSLGDQFSLYQIKTKNAGTFYFGIEACVWAIFEARAKSLSLINADYYVAVPVTYIQNKFAARLRIFHESSHLGDEFLLEHRNIKRLNPSMEALDLSLAYDVTKSLTAFVGVSRILRSDESYEIKSNKVYYGFNYFLDFFKIKFKNLEANPYFAAYFVNSEDTHWKLDSSLAIGYQWDKLYGHKFRVFLEGHDGFSVDGQFSKRSTKYLSLKMLYGY